MTKSYKKITLTIEVLSDGAWEWENLTDVAHQISDGECSGEITNEEIEFLTPDEMAEALIAQGSDPSFLLGEDYENYESKL